MYALLNLKYMVLLFFLRNFIYTQKNPIVFLVEFNGIQYFFTIFQLIFKLTEYRLDREHSEICNQNKTAFNLIKETDIWYQARRFHRWSRPSVLKQI